MLYEKDHREPLKQLWSVGPLTVGGGWLVPRRVTETVPPLDLYDARKAMWPAANAPANLALRAGLASLERNTRLDNPAMTL